MEQRTRSMGALWLLHGWLESQSQICDSVIKPQWKAGELATCGSASFPVGKSGLDLRCHLRGVHKRGTQTGGGRTGLNMRGSWLRERELSGNVLVLRLATAHS